MTDPRPSPAMIAQLDALGRALQTIATARHDASLAFLEEAVLTAVRAALPGLLTEVVSLNTRALREPQAHWPQFCPRCSTKAHVHSMRARTVQTVCGPITVERPWYLCRSCTRGFSPADASLAVAPRSRTSPGLDAWLLDLGARLAFGEAAGLLERLTGLAVSPETIRQHTERTGSRLEAAAAAASEAVQRTGQAVGSVDQAPGTLVVETDGVMVRYLDGWHEVKLGLVAGLVEGELRAPSYLALRRSAEAFGPRLLAEAARRGALTEIGWAGSIFAGRPVWSDVVVLGDGAPWIWKLAAEHFGRHTEIVDFYHASEHLWTVARTLQEGDDTAAGTWAQARVRELYEQGSEPVLKALREARASEEEAAEVLRRERAYFQTNAARMDYPRFREQGLPNGSGAIESAAKHLVQQRMKRPGARWSEAGAQAVLAVRCHLLSGRPLAA
jgi:Uncharacterised protein family (UPF0236)